MARTKSKKTAGHPPETIHTRIAAFRGARKLTQVQLAIQVGVDKTCVSHWENGKSAPSRERLPFVAAALGVTIAELFGEAAA